MCGKFYNDFTSEYGDGYGFGQGDLPDDIYENDEINVVNDNELSLNGTLADSFFSAGFGAEKD